jgi:hypothetical protein
MAAREFINGRNTALNALYFSTNRNFYSPLDCAPKKSHTALKKSSHARMVNPSRCVIFRPSYPHHSTEENGHRGVTMNGAQSLRKHAQILGAR